MVDKVQLNPPPTNIIQHITVGDEQVEFNLPYQLLIWLNTIYNRVGEGPFLIQGYDINGLPDPSQFGSIGDSPFSSWIFIKNESGGPTPAYSDGTNWLKPDGTIVS